MTSSCARCECVLESADPQYWLAFRGETLCQTCYDQCSASEFWEFWGSLESGAEELCRGLTWWPWPGEKPYTHEVAEPFIVIVESETGHPRLEIACWIGCWWKKGKDSLEGVVAWASLKPVER